MHLERLGHKQILVVENHQNLSWCVGLLVLTLTMFLTTLNFVIIV